VWCPAPRVPPPRGSPPARAAFVAVYTAMSVMTVSEIYVYNMAMFYLFPFLASRVDELVVATGHRDGGLR